jgi:HSP20 family protein
MTTTNPWDIVRELASMQERMSRVWEGLHEDVAGRGWDPAVDIYETEGKEVVLKAELPGLTREDIDLTVEHNTLTLRGTRREDPSIGKDRYHRRERVCGAFSRSFTLPNTVDSARVRAEFRDGVLTVSLPVREEARPRQIRVEVSD